MQARVERLFIGFVLIEFTRPARASTTTALEFLSPKRAERESSFLGFISLSPAFSRFFYGHLGRIKILRYFVRASNYVFARARRGVYV